MDESRPIFQHTPELTENEIISSAPPEDTQVSSTNEFAALHRINPATAGKGVNLLVDEGILYKKRGIGMFVSPGARERILAQRRERFRTQYVAPLLAEAAKLGIEPQQLAAMITSPATASSGAAGIGATR